MGKWKPMIQPLIDLIQVGNSILLIMLIIATIIFIYRIFRIIYPKEGLIIEEPETKPISKKEINTAINAIAIIILFLLWKGCN